MTITREEFDALSAKVDRLADMLFSVDAMHTMLHGAISKVDFDRSLDKTRKCADGKMEFDLEVLRQLCV